MVSENNHIQRLKYFLECCFGFIWISALLLWYFGSDVFEIRVLYYLTLPDGYAAILDYILINSIAILTWFIGPKRSKIKKKSDLVMYFFGCNFITLALYPVAQCLILIGAMAIQFYLGFREGVSSIGYDERDLSKQVPMWLKPFYLVITIISGVWLFGSFLSGNTLVMELPIIVASPFCVCTFSTAVFEIGRKKGRRIIVGRKLMLIALVTGIFTATTIASMLFTWINPPSGLF